MSLSRRLSRRPGTRLRVMMGRSGFDSMIRTDRGMSSWAKTSSLNRVERESRAPACDQAKMTSSTCLKAPESLGLELSFQV